MDDNQNHEMKSGNLTWSQRAQRAYEAYGAVTDFKNFQGNPMPKWEELPAKIQHAWFAAAKQVAADYGIPIARKS
jgi:hypothetical protein